MKKFLSLLLAVLMVVSLVPMLFLGVGAEGSQDEPAAFPELMITEIATNTVNYNTGIQIWVGQIPAFTGYSIPENMDEIGDVFRYVEIYNAGTETINLYDYKLVLDTDASAAGTELAYADIADGVAENGTDTAMLAPGKCAVIWLRSNAEIDAELTVAQFKGYYEWQYSMGNTAYTFALDLSETPVIVSDVASGFDFAATGQVIYGIAADTVVDTDDTTRDATWESWVHWYSHLGIAANNFTAFTVTVGETNVTGGTVFVWNDKTLTYYVPSLENGGADENGKAVADLEYFTADLSKVTSSDFHNNAEKSSCHFLYGYDVSKPLHVGFPYAWSSTDQTPGILNSVQSAVLPAPGVETDTPDLVISEVSPLPKNEAYEYIEIVNISDKAVNVYDYSVVQSGSYVNLRTQFFNKVNTLIPGDYGNIYAATPNSNFYDYNLRNPEYAKGWLAPGETALLWSCTNNVPLNYINMSSFYGYYGLDESTVKVFAYDSNPTVGTVHTDLANYGFLMIGLAKNEKIGWTGDPYISAPLMSPIKMSGGVATAVSRGVTIEDCESLVLTNSVLMANTTTAIADGYAHQYTWNKYAGSANKVGTPIAIGNMMTAYQNNTSYVFADPVIGDAFLASPATLTASQKNDVTVPQKDARYVLYMEDYADLADGKLAVDNSEGATAFLDPLCTVPVHGQVAYTVAYQLSYSNAEGAVLTDATVRIEVGADGVAAYYVNDVLTADPAGAYISVSDTGVVMFTDIGITATYDSVVVYATEDISEAATFYYVGDLANGEAIYLEAAMVDNKDISAPDFSANVGAVTANIGAETKLSFTATLDREYVRALKDYNLKYSMIVFRTADRGAVSAYSAEAFEAAGIDDGTYTYVENVSNREVGKNYRLTLNDVTMAENYYRDSYTAVGIISMETVFGTVTLYSECSESVTVTQVLASALQDISDTRSAEYCYDLGDNTWARYTPEQMKAFAKICKQAI